MYTSRISDLLSTQTLSGNISSTKQQYLRQIQTVSSGYKYLDRSDDPVATSTAQALNNELTANGQWSDNVSTLNSWESTTDTTLQSVLSLLNRVEELTTESQGGTLSESDKSTIATEINEILESLVQYGNQDYDGVNIFAGTATCVDKSGTTCTDAVTVDRDTDGNITAVYFLGQNTTDPSLYTISNRSTNISNTSSMSYGTLGTDLFMYTYTDPSDGTETQVNVFQELINFRDQMNGTYTGTDTASTTIAHLESAVSNVTECEVDCAARENRLTSAASNITSINSALESRVSDVEDIDEAAAITELYNTQTALTAALQMTSKINEMSLVNYI